MFNIKYHLPTFIRELKRGTPLRVSLDGDFYVENFLQKSIRRIFKLDQRRLIDAASAFYYQLNALESVPVQFSESQVQEVNFSLYVEAGQLLLDKMHPYQSRKAVRVRKQLERAVVALLYRLEGENGGFNPGEPDEGLFHQLLHAAQVWKLTQPIFPEKRLEANEKTQLYDVSRYPFFANLVLQDEELAEELFVWILRDGIDVRPFIEFPHQQWKINRYALNGRLSRLGGKDLAVQKVDHENGLEKVLTLPFEGQPISILDETKSVLFRGNYGLTIREVFEIFDYKRIEAGNLEYMADGIINWNAHHWGYWDADLKDYVRIDFEKDAWWRDLPVLDHMNLQQAREMFGNHLTGKEWNLALISTRISQDLDFENAHAYTSISAPQGDGSYIVYTLGKFTFTFPETLLQALMNIGETAEATVAYPDENAFYTHRRKTRYSYAISETEARRYFESVKKDMLLSREGNLIYQIESENCAKWSYEKLIDAVGQQRVPEIYSMPFLDSEPHGVMERVFDVLKSLPLKWQIPVTTFIHFLLGGYKGRLIIENGRATWKSLTHHEFWDDTVIFHPSMLYKQQEEGNIGRFVHAGITMVGKATLSVVLEGISVFSRKVTNLVLVTYRSIVRAIISILEFSALNTPQLGLPQQIHS